MKMILNKKIASSIFLPLVIFSCFFAYPRKSQAQWAVIDPVNLVQNVLSNISEYASSALDYSDNYKEYILDPLVSALAETVLQQMTRSIVTWINNGFAGSPSFIQNPGKFFLDIADQETGQFIKGDLADLCSPFSIDIRIALSFKYRPNVQKRYACTLGTIISNSKNAVKNASINGFTAGDFKQGGWPAFVSLTTEPQNNIFGAYLQADSDLSFRVANKQLQQKDELNQGKGFLSWKKCHREVTTMDDGTGDTGPTAGTTVIDTSGDTGPTAGDEVCEIQTPGSVIADSLQKQLDIPVEKLGLADEIGEIVNALFAQLATQVLQKGLAAVSHKDASGSSYLDSVVNDLQNQQKAGDIGSRVANDIDGFISIAKRYLDNRSSSFEIVASIKATYDSAEACYTDKIQNNQPPLDANETLLAQSRIAGIRSVTDVNTGFYSVYKIVEANARDAQDKYDSLVTAKEQATNAKSLQEINDAAELFRRLSDINSPSRLDERNVQTALDDYNKLLTNTESIRADAASVLQQCQAFPPPKTASTGKNN